MYFKLDDILLTIKDMGRIKYKAMNTGFKNMQIRNA